MTSENLNNTSVPANEKSLKDLLLEVKIGFNYILSKYKTILLFVIIGFVAGFLYSRFKKPMYTATTSFVLEESGGGGGVGASLGQFSGLASMAGIDIGGGGSLFSGENILELYKSRTMLQKALLSRADFNGKQELLVDKYIEFNHLREKWDDKPGLKGISFDNTSKFTILQDSLLGDFIKDINENYLSVSKPDKKVSIIRVSIRSKNQPFAKTFNNRLVATVNDFYVQTKTKKSLENVAILQHQTDSVKKVLNGAIYSVVQTMDATPNLNPTRQVLRAPVQRSQFNAEANKAILTQLVQNLELSKISLRKETPLIQVVDEPIFPLPKESLGMIKGVVFGGMLFGFITVFWLLLSLILKNILSSE